MKSEPIVPHDLIKQNIIDEEYNFELNLIINSINNRLMKETVESYSGKKITIHYQIPDIHQCMLLDLVIRYKEKGWRVTYGKDTYVDRKDVPYIEIGF